MKKQWIAICLVVLLLFAACSAPVPEPPVMEDLPEQQLPEETPPEEETPSEEETPPEEEAPPAVETPMGSEILQQKPEGEALWKLENPYVQQGVQQQLLIFDGQLLVFGQQYGEEGSAGASVALISLQTGETLHHRALPDFDMGGVQLCDGGPAVYDWISGTVLFLDETLQIVHRVDTGHTSGALAVSPDGERVYCVTAETGIRVLDRQGQETGVLLEHAAGLYGAENSGKAMSLTYTDRNTQLQVSAVLDLEQGAVLNNPFEGVYYGTEYADALWLAAPYGEQGKYLIGRGERPYCFYPEAKYTSAQLLTEPVRLLVKSYGMDGSTTMQLYAPDGAYLSQCTVQGSQAGAAWSERDGGYFLTVTDETGHDMLLFWDLSVPTGGTDLKLEPNFTQQPETGAVSQSLYDRASALGQQYGVQIRIAEQLAEEYGEFSAWPETDEATVTAGLDALEEALAALPANLIPQLPYGTVRTLEIHLTGGVYKTEQPAQVSGFDSFNGFTHTTATVTVIALDIARPGQLKQVFFHELGHAIDNKLAFDAKLREDALYNEQAWMALNPEGFVYAETYDEMPMSYFSDGYEAWFLDLYSRTFAREDRARVLEYTFLGSDWIFGTAQRQAKRDYLLQCMADCFDTTGWSFP